MEEVDAVVARPEAGAVPAASCAAGAEKVDDAVVALEAGAEAAASCAATVDGATAATTCAEEVDAAEATTTLLWPRLGLERTKQRRASEARPRPQARRNQPS